MITAMMMPIAVMHVVGAIMRAFVNDHGRSANRRGAIHHRWRCIINPRRRGIYRSGSHTNRWRGDIDGRRQRKTDAEAERNASAGRRDACGTDGDSC
jgi:hypothetical protein